LIFKIIEESGSMGIWVRRIKSESRLHANTVDKVLKRLEKRQLIKSVASAEVIINSK